MPAGEGKVVVKMLGAASPAANRRVEAERTNVTLNSIVMIAVTVEASRWLRQQHAPALPLAADDTEPRERRANQAARSPRQQWFTSGKQEDRPAHAPNVCRLRPRRSKLPCPVADAVPKR
jgi:hypothetical protein